jgi:hypothetical protein
MEHSEGKPNRHEKGGVEKRKEVAYHAQIQYLRGGKK